MDAKEYIKGQMAAVRQLIDAAMQETTDEQFNWAPPGTANPIGATLVHTIAGEDFFVQNILQGKPRIWETGGWSEKIGLTTPPGRGRGWDEIKGKTLVIAPVLAYQQAVRAATDACLANLTAEDLDRKVTFVGTERPVADVIALVIAHTAHHTGEISALKGVQGGKGLPF